MAVFVSSLSIDEKIDLRDQLARFDFLGQLKQVDRDFAISQLTPEEMRMEKIFGTNMTNTLRLLGKKFQHLRKVRKLYLALRRKLLKYQLQTKVENFQKNIELNLEQQKLVQNTPMNGNKLIL
jgi:hypothetical protein